tara:strand:+ start:3957 stop:4739 length:783 start_codon:yes stop_codon:yes gene_type:complete
MIKNTNLKESFRKRKLMFGSWTSIGDHQIAEIFSKSEIDFLGIDIEHSSISYKDAQNIILAAHSSKVPCLPRIATLNKESIKRLLDLGADGLIVPNVETKSEVDQIIEWMKYPPLGKRGYGISQAQGYGFDFNTYSGDWNKKSTLIIQIESITAVENLESLIVNDEIDAVMIGPYDISGSLGVPGEIYNNEVKKACKKVLDICKKFNKSCGIQDIEPNEKSIKNNINLGYNFIVLASDVFVLWKWTEKINNLIKSIDKNT